MQKIKLLILGGVALCATIVLAQTLPPTLPTSRDQRGGLRYTTAPETAKRISQVQGRQYLSVLTSSEAESGHAWSPTSPIPLSLAQAEEIARRELRELLDDKHGDFGWEFTELSLHRLNGNASPNWYFAATLKPIPAVGEENPDSFTVLINAAGEVGRFTSGKKL